MGLFLISLSALCVLPVCSISDRLCLKKEPAPGVLVIPPGSQLVLTCSGRVKVNGVQIGLSQDTTTQRPPLRASTAGKVTTNTAASSNSSETSVHNSQGYYTANSEGFQSTSPLIFHQTKESDSGKKTRLSRNLQKAKPQWLCNNQLVSEKAGRDGTTLTSDGTTLTLASVMQRDAGKYTCQRKEEVIFAVKVLIAVSPEKPSLSCYMKSPRSKIRCEWKLQKQPIKSPHCSLFMMKDKNTERAGDFKEHRCSYSPRPPRCWCALEHNEDDKDTKHRASLCATSILGNATSDLLIFTPMNIVKPDPPSKVTVQPVEGQERMLKVTWKSPTSWNIHDGFYILFYEIRYKPLVSEIEQVNGVQESYYIITDALTGAEYLIWVRSKEEYSGQWSEWSPPVYARTWTAPVLEAEDLTTTAEDLYPLDGSGSAEDGDTDARENNSNACNVKFHLLWIPGLLAFLSAILAVYIFRNKDRFIYKLQLFSTITPCCDPYPPPPSIPAGEALLTSDPELHKQHLPRDSHAGLENKEEEPNEKDKTESMNLNNKSYFLLQME